MSAPAACRREEQRAIHMYTHTHTSPTAPVVQRPHDRRRSRTSCTGASKTTAKPRARRSGRAQPCRRAWTRCAMRWRRRLPTSTRKPCGRYRQARLRAPVVSARWRRERLRRARPRAAHAAARRLRSPLRDLHAAPAAPGVRRRTPSSAAPSARTRAAATRRTSSGAHLAPPRLRRRSLPARRRAKPSSQPAGVHEQGDCGGARDERGAGPAAGAPRGRGAVLFVLARVRWR